MTDLKMAAVCAGISLPFLLWNTFRCWQKKEVFLTDDDGKITAHYTRDHEPIRFWLVLGFNVALTVGAMMSVLWEILPPALR
jgi:hypothetical protein